MSKRLYKFNFTISEDLQDAEEAEPPAENIPVPAAPGSVDLENSKKAAAAQTAVDPKAPVPQ